jgi:hypothetical protein
LQSECPDSSYSLDAAALQARMAGGLHREAAI